MVEVRGEDGASAILLRGGWVITGGGPDDAVIRDGAVLVEGERVGAVGPWAELRTRHPAASVIGGPDHAVLPGLINGHHHSSAISAVQHGLSDALLEPWCLDHLRIRLTDDRLDCLLAATRLLQTGVTAAVDVWQGPPQSPAAYERAARARLAGYEQAGLRAFFALGHKTQSRIVHGGPDADDDFIAGLPANVRPHAQALLPAGPIMDDGDWLDVVDQLARDTAGHPRLAIWYGPQGPQWIHPGVMERIAEAGVAHDSKIQTHVNESWYEAQWARRQHGGRETVAWLGDIGVLGPRFSLAHATFCSPAEIEILAATGTAVSHNPGSNLRLRNGAMPLNAMRAAGVTVAIGMDGTTMDDDEDMWAEMRLAARLARTTRLSGPAPAPRELLHMATAGGARLARMEDRLGRLAPGMLADVITLDTRRVRSPWAAAEADMADLLVMKAAAGDVDTVLVGGAVVLRGGLPTRFDLKAALAEAHEVMAAQARPEQAEAHVAAVMPYLEKFYLGWEEER
ncbi:MAG: amidohydrolase family protein [Alphaproteobacteria bacterium]